MAHLPFFSYDGYGKDVEPVFHYSQAVKRGDIIEISGQGGWDPKTHAVDPDINKQIDQAFENVQLALVTAGGQGWVEVYKIRAYFTNLDDPTHIDAFVRNMRKWLPGHKPLLTAVGVKVLAFENMKVEIEVAAETKSAA